MAQSAISFSVLVSKSSFPIIDIVIGFEINACQTELLVSNLNEQFRTALVCLRYSNFCLFDCFFNTKLRLFYESVLFIKVPWVLKRLVGVVADICGVWPH